MDVMVATVQEWLNDTYSLGVTVDGVTGNNTFKALIKALQIEIGVSADGDFGSGTLAACPTMQEVEDTSTATPSNLTYILQGSFWCKGYNPGGFTGIFGPGTTEAVKEFQSDAGITQDGIVTPYILQGLMNTDGYAFTETDDEELNYKHQVQMGLNQYYGSQIGLIAPNGLWERKSHRNLIKACQIEWGATVDGIWGSGTMSLAPTLSINTTGYTNSKRLLQWALAVNGFYADNFAGTFNSSTKTAVTEFQDLMELGADGIAGKNTWASLLVSYGNTSRAGTACDTSTRLTATTSAGLKNAGYQDVGRYLVNVQGGTLDKKMTDEELQIIEDAGLNVFPIYQTYGGEASYFTRAQGQADANEAKEAAKDFGFPYSTVIYFAVDYDVLMADIEDYIIPYFRGIKEIMGNTYKIGVYGPRAVCNSLHEYGLATRSFVSDMSSSYTGNIGVKMPSNWAYDQIVTTTAGGVSIDKCVASASRRTAISPSEFVVHGSLIEEGLESIIGQFNMAVFKNIYDFAKSFILDEYTDNPSIFFPTTYNSNLIALQYLRTSAYGGDLWAIIAGDPLEEFAQYIKKYDNDFNPSTVSFTNPGDNTVISFPHFAATLNACIFESLVSFAPPAILRECEVDVFAGWGGDLIQMGITLELTANQGYNYFNINDLMTLIGSTSESLNGYHLYTKRDDGTIIEMETPSSGFGLEDLYQDVDAFNIYRLYDLAETPFYLALADYYYGNKYYQQRFTIFMRELCLEFDNPVFSDIIRRVACGHITFLSDIFQAHFGGFSYDEYGEVLATGFTNKIQILAAQETLSSLNES